MTRKRTFVSSAISLSLALVVMMLAACGSASPAASPATSSAASAKASTSSPSPAASSASPAASASASSASGAYVPDEQLYQKAQANWPNVLDAARKEGQGVFYADQSPDLINTFQAEFNKIDPKIQIQLMRVAGQAGGIERLRAEQATKQYISNGYFGTARPIANAGVCQLIEDLPAAYEPGSKWVASPFMDKPHETITWSFAAFFILVNTNLVPAGQEPKSWKDLADPKWKDKILLWDPRVAGVAKDALSLFYSSPEFGPDWVHKLLENGRIMSDSLEAQRMVARGDAAMTIGTASTYQTIKEAPVKLVTPQDGPLATPGQVVIAKNAPQLNIAKVFVNWLLSKEGQLTLTKVSKGSALIRTDVQAPADQITLGNIKLMPGIPFTWDLAITQSDQIAPNYIKWIEQMNK